MVERDGLTEEQIPMNARCGAPSKVIGRLTGETRPSLSDLRNESAHGAQFDGFSQAGLLELVRDLIDYSYRDWPPEFSARISKQYQWQIRLRPRCKNIAYLLGRLSARLSIARQRRTPCSFIRKL